MMAETTLEGQGELAKEGETVVLMQGTDSYYFVKLQKGGRFVQGSWCVAMNDVCSHDP